MRLSVSSYQPASPLLTARKLANKFSVDLESLRLIEICQCIPFLIKFRQVYLMLHENTDLNTFLGTL